MAKTVRRLRRGAAVLAGALALGTGALVVAPPAATAATGCAVRYMGTVHWGSGFQAQVTITPGAAVTAWTVDFDVADQQVVAFAAYANFTQSVRHVRLSNVSFNGTVAAGASVTVLVGVHTNPTYTNVPPDRFVVNGQICSYTPPPYFATDAHRVDVPEGGATAVAVRLSAPPPSTVAVTVSGGSADGVITATPASLTFTPANWNVPQTVTLRSTEDSDVTNQTGTFNISQQNYIQGYSPVINAVILATQHDND